MMYDPSFHYVSSHPIDIDSKNKDDNTLQFRHIQASIKKQSTHACHKTKGKVKQMCKIIACYSKIFMR